MLPRTTNLLADELSLSGIMAVFLEEMELLQLLSLGCRLEVLSSLTDSDVEREYASALFGVTSLASLGGST